MIPLGRMRVVTCLWTSIGMAAAMAQAKSTSH